MAGTVVVAADMRVAGDSMLRLVATRRDSIAAVVVGTLLRSRPRATAGILRCLRRRPGRRTVSTEVLPRRLILSNRARVGDGLRFDGPGQGMTAIEVITELGTIR